MAEAIITSLRIIGQRAYINAARSAASSVREIGQASNETTAGMQIMAGAGSVVKAGFRVMSLAATTAATAITAVGVAAAKTGLAFRAQIEDATVGMTTLLNGNKKLANSTVKAVTEFAKNSPKLDVSAAVQSTQLLIGAGLKAKRAVPVMKTFSDTLSAMGKRPEDLTRITYAFMQMMSKGQISAEELRGQLGEIFPASKLLAKGMGISMAELADRMKTGSLKGMKYVNILLDQMQKKFKGGTKRSAMTFNGMLANIKENAKYTLGVIFEPLFFFLKDKIFPWVAKIGTRIQKWAEGGGVKRLISSVKQGFTGRGPAPKAVPGRALHVSDVAEQRKAAYEKKSPLEKMFFNIAKVAGKVFPLLVKYSKQFFDALKPAKPFFDNVLVPLITGFGKGLFAGIVALIPLIRLFATGLGWIGQKMAPLKPLLEKVGFLLGFVFGPGKLGLFRPFGAAFRFIGARLAALRGPFMFVFGLISRFIGWFWKASGAGRKFVAIVVTWAIRIGETWVKIIVGVAKFARKFASTIWRAVSKVLGWFKTLGSKIAGSLAGAVGAVVSAATNFGKSIGSALGDGIWNALPDWARKLLGATGGLLKKAFETVTGGGGGGSATPSATTSHPTATAGHSRAQPTVPPVHVTVQNHLQWRGREVAVAVAQDTSDRRARR